MNFRTVIFKWKFMSFSRFLPAVKVKKKFTPQNLKCHFAVAVIFWVIGKLSWMLLKAAKHSKINAAI